MFWLLKKVNLSCHLSQVERGQVVSVLVPMHQNDKRQNERQEKCVYQELNKQGQSREVGGNS